jgi:hypothetical protein
MATLLCFRAIRWLPLLDARFLDRAAPVVSTSIGEKGRCPFPLCINRPEIVRLNAIMKEKFRRRGVILPDRASARATAFLVRAMSCVDRDAISLEAIHNALDRSSSARLCAKVPRFVVIFAAPHDGSGSGFPSCRPGGTSSNS